MLQIIDGKQVYVVEFKKMPELPITWEEDKPEEKPYALALARAIHTKVITRPGKYAIYIVSDKQYEIYTLKEQSLVAQTQTEERSVYSAMKIKIRKTKQFVQKHPTSTACAMTALVTWKFTKDATLKGVLEETTALAYQWGREAGTMRIALDEAYNFIKSEDLTDAFVEYVHMAEIP